MQNLHTTIKHTKESKKVHSILNMVDTCHDLAKRLSYYLYFFFFSFLTTTRWSVGKYYVTLSQCHNLCDRLSHMVTVTVCHMTKVTRGPWESKCIATVVKCISSREMSKNSIEFSLSNSEQRDSWLNSGHRGLDADNTREQVQF